MLLDLKVHMHTKLLAISCLIKMATIKHTMYAGAGEVAQQIRTLALELRFHSQYLCDGS